MMGRAAGGRLGQAALPVFFSWSIDETSADLSADIKNLGFHKREVRRPQHILRRRGHIEGMGDGKGKVLPALHHEVDRPAEVE